MKKKLISAILCVVMTGTLFCGCGGNNATDSGTSADNQGESAAPVTEGESEAGEKTYSMFMRKSYVGWIQELKWYDEAEKRTGIHVDYVEGPDEFDDVYAEVDQRIISNTLPDAVMTKLEQSDVYGPQGAFVNLAPYIEQYAPNLQQYIDENEDYKALITQEDGAIYGLVKEDPLFSEFMAYRVDHLEKAGISPDSIQTVNDLTDAMRKLKEFYGKDNPNYYPLTGRESPMRYAAWFDCLSTVAHGVFAGHGMDGSFNIMSDNAYTMVETMKAWYDEGLIQPQFAEGTYTEGDWEADVINGNGTFFYDHYKRADWFMSNGGKDADPDFQMAILGNFKDGSGKILPNAGTAKYNTECTTAVNANCDEETIKTILTFIDYFYSQEGRDLANYGVEGESYEVTADGKKEFIVDYVTEENKPEGEKKWSFLSDRFTVCMPADTEAFHQWNPELIADACSKYMKGEYIRPGINISYTSEQSEELSNLIATVYDAEVAGIISFVTGNSEFNQDEWKAFQDEMNSMGLSRIEELQMEAYKNTYGKDFTDN